jgi:serine/threonine protein kinase
VRATAEDAEPNDTPTAKLLDLLGPTDDPNMLGRIGPYEIIGLLGQGGMGAVFKGFDRSLNRFVAIKMLLPHLAASGAARKRFAREGQAVAAVVDDHVMAIHCVDEWQGVPYLVMTYSRGVSLQKRLSDNGPLEVREILRIGMQAAKGLAAAHAQGIVHRDIKPANIFLDQNVERVQLMDFGLARAVDDASLTRSGTLAGTPQYMSPEQTRAETVDHRSDLFSLGSVMYAMCTGHAPFRAESSYSVLRLITDKEPRPIREINPDVPEWLCSIINKLMAKQASERFDTAKQVADLLEDCLAHVQQPTSAPLPASLVPQATTGRFVFNVARIRVMIMLGTIGMTLFGMMLWQAPEPPENKSQNSTNHAEATESDRTKGIAAAKRNEQQAQEIANLPRFYLYANYVSGWLDGMSHEADRSEANLEKAMTQRLKPDTPSSTMITAWDEERLLFGYDKPNLDGANGNTRIVNHYFSHKDSIWQRQKTNKDAPQYANLELSAVWKRVDARAFFHLRSAYLEFPWGNSFGNIKFALVPIEFAEYQLVGDESIDGTECWVVMSKPCRCKLWFDQKSGRLLQMLNYVMQGVESTPFQKTPEVEKLCGREFETLDEFHEFGKGTDRATFQRLAGLYGSLYFDEMSQPIELTRFSDYREIAPGIWFPHQATDVSAKQSPTDRNKFQFSRGELRVITLETGRSLEETISAFESEMPK